MYDLISGSPPFHQEQVDSILWRIGTGHTTSFQDVKCNARLKVKPFHLLYKPIKWIYPIDFIEKKITGFDDVLLGVWCGWAAQLRRSGPPSATVGSPVQIAFVFRARTIKPTRSV